MVGKTRGKSTRKLLVLQRTEETCVIAGVIRLRCHLYFTGKLHSPWANSKKTSLNGCSFLSPGRKVCLLILKEEGLKMMNPFVGRKKSCRMLSKRNFSPSAFGRPLSSADTRPGARRLPAFIQAGAHANIDWAAASSCVAEFVTSSSCSFFSV